MVKLEPVSSSCVSSAGYDEQNRILVIDFIKTGVYTYFDVSPDIHSRFMSAPSMGAFVNYVFKSSNWPYQKGYPDAAMTAPLE
jgi:hypothetical protein